MTKIKEVKEKKEEFIYWIHAIAYAGKVTKCILKENLPEIDPMDWLEQNMADLMIKNDWATVIDYRVLKTGFDLKISDFVQKKPKKVVAPVIKEVEKIITKTITLPTLDYVKLAIQGRPSPDNVWCSHIPLKFKNYAEITKELKSLIAGKKILFLENDSILDNSVGNFYRWTLENKIDSFCLFDIRHLPKEFIAAKIIEYDLIAFQSQFVYEESRALVEFVKGLKIPKTFIECQPESHFNKSTAPQHQIFALDCMSGDAYWEWELFEEK